MKELFPVVVLTFLHPALVLLILLVDEHYLSPERRARAWPGVTIAVASCIGFFGLPFLSLPIHFGRTRRTVLGVVLGFVVAALALGVLVGVDLGLVALGFAEE